MIVYLGELTEEATPILAVTSNDLKKNVVSTAAELGWYWEDVTNSNGKAFLGRYCTLTVPKEFL